MKCNIELYEKDGVMCFNSDCSFTRFNKTTVKPLSKEEEELCKKGYTCFGFEGDGHMYAYQEIRIDFSNERLANEFTERLSKNIGNEHPVDMQFANNDVVFCVLNGVYEQLVVLNSDIVSVFLESKYIKDNGIDWKYDVLCGNE